MRLPRNVLFRTARPSAPRGHRAYAVGDIHGRLDLLESLLGLIEADLASRKKLQTAIVFLGDLIDRGPDSAAVIEKLRRYEPDLATPVFLMGNHEEVFLRVLDGDVKLIPDWLRFGGAECIRSYSLDPASLKRMPPDQAVEAVKNTVPETHIDFIRSFADTVSFGSYLFVHAGIRPGVRLPEQRQTDLRWIRHPFLDDISDHGFTVVHGHTITNEVDVRPNRIGVDTGAYRSGVLTALGIEGRDRWFLQTGGAMISHSQANWVQMGSKIPDVAIGG